MYSWMSRSFWILRPASDRKVQLAPTEARNSRVTAILSVETVTMPVVGDGDLRLERGELAVLLLVLRAVVSACQHQDHWVVALQVAQTASHLRVVCELVVRERSTGSDVSAHGCSSLVPGMTSMRLSCGEGTIAPVPTPV